MKTKINGVEQDWTPEIWEAWDYTNPPVPDGEEYFLSVDYLPPVPQSKVPPCGTGRCRFVITDKKGRVFVKEGPTTC